MAAHRMVYRHDGFPEEQEPPTYLPDLEVQHGNFGCLHKVALIGNSSVGKTSFVDRYINYEYNEDMKSTIGVDFATRCLRDEFSGGKRRRVETLQLWDTAGMERYRAVTQSYYRSMDAIIVMYDVTNMDSFMSLPNWIDDIARVASSADPLLYIVGNKTDLDDRRMVPTKMATNFAMQCGIPFTETSVKEDLNVSNTMETVIEHLRNRWSMRAVMEKEERVVIVLDEEAQITAQQERPIYGGCWC